MANLYDMMREKARGMGHAVANAPDAAFSAAIDVKNKSHNLAVAKLCIQQYMMGEMDPRDMARWMADNPDIRVAMSDLCRVRLEPIEFDVQRGDGYIDVAAGIKTFWTEMKVPLPSEKDAARDLLNINYGIEAGKQANGQINGQIQGNVQGNVQRNAQKISLRDKLNEMKQNAAKKAIDVLSPIAEGKQADVNEQPVTAPHINELNEAWFETEEGRQYKDDMTRRTAMRLENMSMAIEAGLDPNIPEPEREKALRAAGVKEAKPAELRAGYTRDELNEPLDTSMKALFDQIAEHMGQDVKQKAPADEKMFSEFPDAKKESVEFSRQKGKIVGEFEGKKVRFKENFRDHVFTDDEAMSLLRGEGIIVDYTDKNDNERRVAGKLEWQNYEGRRFLGFKADFSKKLEETQSVLSEKKAPDVGKKTDETQKTISEKQALPETEELSDPQVTNEEIHNLFGDEDDYYAKMAKDMEGYVPEDQPLILTESDLQFGDAQDAGFELSRT